MLYVLIRDEMSKVKKYKVKSKVEIKGENVRLIFSRVDPTAHQAPLTCALIGGAQPTMVGGSCHAALYKEVG
jgi:hypothetical protein